MMDTVKRRMNDIIKRYKLSESFIEKYANKVDWTIISEYQKLSERFIEKYAHKVHWSYISIYQDLSEGFIERNKDRLWLMY